MPRLRKSKLFGLSSSGLLLLLAVFGVFVFSYFARAAFNPQINYQGKLTDASDNAVADGNYNFRFRLCTASSGGACSGSVVMDETYEGSSKISVTSGLFSVMLGSASSSLSSVNFNQDLYLEVQVGGSGTPSWETLSPVKRLGAVANAFNAEKFDGYATTSFLRSDASNAAAIFVNTTSTNATSSGSLYVGSSLGLNSVYISNWSDLTSSGFSSTSADYWDTTKNRWTSENATTSFNQLLPGFATFVSSTYSTQAFTSSTFLSLANWFSTTSATQLTTLGNINLSKITSTQATTTGSVYIGGNLVNGTLSGLANWSAGVAGVTTTPTISGLTVTGASTLSTVSVSSNATTSGYLTVGTAPTGALFTAGNLNVQNNGVFGGYVTTTGGLFTLGNLSVSGASTFVGTVSGAGFNSAVDSRISDTWRGQANGLASLGADGKVPTAQLSPLAITDTFVVSSESAMLALSAQVGDVAVRTDLSKSYILRVADATVLSNWTELIFPTDAVSSVNGQSGAVTLSSDDITEGLSNLYFTNARVDDRINTTWRGMSNGLASLDSTGKIPTSQLGALPVNDTYVVAATSSLLTSGATKGDLGISTDLNKTYVLQGADATVWANWVEILSGASVTSVNSLTGAVTLTTSNISEGTNQYWSQSRFDSALTAATTWTGDLYVSSGNIGIGIVTTTNALEVMGNASTSQDMFVGDALYVGYSNGSNSDVIYFNAAAESLAWNTTNNRFEFSDGVYISNNATTSGYLVVGTSLPTGYGTATGDINLQNNLAAGGNGVFGGSLSVASNATTSGYLTVGTAPTGASFSAGSLNVQNRLVVPNASTTNLSVSGNASFGTTTITNLAVTNLSTSTFAGGLTVGTTMFVVDQNTGYVGIGTANPLANFGVVAANPRLVVSDASEQAFVSLEQTSDVAYLLRDDGDKLNIGTRTSAYDTGAITTQLTIDTTGYVGIGTSSPYRKLAVITESSSNNPGILVDGIGVGGAAIEVDRASASWESVVRFSGANIMNWKLGMDNDSTSNFYLMDNGDNKMLTVVDNGTTPLIGIGTTSPQVALHVVKNGGVPSLTADTNAISIIETGGLGNDPQLEFGGYTASPYGMWIQTKQSNNSGATFPLSINPLGGNVGIGTSTPDSLLQVGDATNYFKVSSAGNATTTGYLSVGTAPTGATFASGSLNAGTTTITNLVVNNLSTSTFAGGLTVGTSQFVVQQSTGYVGIGVASPANALDVNGNIRVQGGIIKQTDGNTYIGIEYPTTDELAFVANGAERMRIKSTGYVGIATTTPVSLFTVQSYNASDHNLSLAGAGLAVTDNIGTYGMYIRNRGASSGIASTTYVSQLYSGTAGNGMEIYTPNAGSLTLGTAGVNRMSIIGSGSSAGYFSLGTTTANEFFQIYSTAGTAKLYSSWINTSYNGSPYTTYSGVVLGGINVKTKTDGGSGDTNERAALKFLGTANVQKPGVDMTFITGGSNTASSEKMRLTGGGFLGVGTTTPGAILSVAALSLGTSPLLMVSTSTATATTTALVMDSSGKFGISASNNPSYLFQVGSISDKTYFSVDSGGNSTSSGRLSVGKAAGANSIIELRKQGALKWSLGNNVTGDYFTISTSSLGVNDILTISSSTGYVSLGMGLMIPGLANAILSTDASGLLVATTSGSGAPAGASGQVQFNNGSALGASSKFTWDNSGFVLSVFGKSSSTSFYTPTGNFNSATQAQNSYIASGRDAVNFNAGLSGLNAYISVGDDMYTSGDAENAGNGGNVYIANAGSNAGGAGYGNGGVGGTISMVAGGYSNTGVYSNDGTINIGATSASGLHNATVNVYGVIQVQYGAICVDSDGCTASSTHSGAISAKIYNTGNSDVAENYTSVSALEAGDIVAPTGGRYIEKASQAAAPFGIISTNPGVLLGSNNLSGQYPVALNGRVPVKVNLEGGAINVGDRIALSSVPGIGKRATSSEPSVGIALETFNDGSPQSGGVGSILVFVNVSEGNHRTEIASIAESVALLDSRLGQVELLLSPSTSTLETTSSAEADYRSLAVRGAATFYGKMTVIGEAEFKSFVYFREHVYFNSDSAGRVEIPANATSTRIFYEKPYAVAPIVTISAADNIVGYSYWTANEAIDGFDIVISTSSDRVLKFNWHAIAVSPDENAPLPSAPLAVSIDTLPLVQTSEESGSSTSTVTVVTSTEGTIASTTPVTESPNQGIAISTEPSTGESVTIVALPANDTLAEAPATEEAESSPSDELPTPAPASEPVAPVETPAQAE